MIAIVGRPNVGKSTLLNAFLGMKLAIVSRRPQTTRNRILGVRTIETDQLVFVDTPGIHRRRSNINRFIVQQALEGVVGVDCIVLVTEVLGPRQAVKETSLHADDHYVLGEVLKIARDVPLVVAINKIDRLKDRQMLLPVIDRWQQAGYHCIVPVSANQEDGLDRLLRELRERLPAGPHLFPEEMLTDQAERFIAAEFIREQVFVQSREEVPYSTAVEIERFEERMEQADVVIEAAIYVERESQKAILIGHRGGRVKEIGSRARQQIGELLDCPVHLQLTVRVADDWTKNPAERRRFGYE
jgi:GTP-binding protein Era